MNIKDISTDYKDLEIVTLLQKNPRMSIAELARKIRMSNPAAKDRVLRLEKSGLIAGYRLELNPKAFGHEITAFVRIRPLPGHLPKISALAKRIPEVVECHRITGEDCFILKVHLPEIASLDQVLDRFLVHGQTTTSIVQSSPVPPRSPPLPTPATRSRRRRTRLI
jgi:Lrp/AsnC family transcriptional regulator, leucine-responsive regulatory protein